MKVHRTVVSALDGRGAQPIWVLTAAAAPSDFAVIPQCYHRKGTTPSPVGHRRAWAAFHETGFRVKTLAAVLAPDPRIAAKFFGLTMRGALPNVSKAGGRHLWRSEEVR